MEDGNKRIMKMSINMGKYFYLTYNKSKEIIKMLDKIIVNISTEEIDSRCYELKHCTICCQMTNHVDVVCLKCIIKNG